MAETSTIFEFMKYVSATDILSDFKKTVDSYFVNSLRNVSLKHFGDSVVTFKKPIFSIKSSLFFLYLSSQEKKTHRSELLLKLRFRILTKNKITNI